MFKHNKCNGFLSGTIFKDNRKYYKQKTSLYSEALIDDYMIWGNP